MALGSTSLDLDFPSLTVDGSFTTEAALTATHLAAGGVSGGGLLRFCGGLAAGAITGLLSTGADPSMLAGILTQIALYSIGTAASWARRTCPCCVPDAHDPVAVERHARRMGVIAIFAAMIVVFILVLDWFLSTDMGFGLRATGDSESMARANGINTDAMKIVGLSCPTAWSAWPARSSPSTRASPTSAWASGSSSPAWHR